MSTETPEDRLSQLRRSFSRKKKNGNQLFWMKYNPDSEFKFDLIDAREDIEWMIAEIERLREENRHLKEFVDSIRSQIDHDLKNYS